MYLDERGYTVLKTIVNNPAITGKEVEASLQLSRKQLSYAIEKINDYLQDNGMPKIERLRTGKFIIPVAVIEQYQTEEITGDGTTYIYTDKERGLLIFLMLLCVREELSIYHFTSKLEISKNTFLTDLKKLEQRLEEYHLEVLYSRQEGYHLVGSEYAKREMMVTSIRGILKIPRGKETIMDICQISEEMMEQVEKQISMIEERLQVRFTDERLKDVLVEETVQVLDHVLPWEDAIQTVAKPLLDRGDITERYVQKAIDNIKADKPFIMIADGVIIAHAGVDDGAKRVCLSLLTMPERTDVYGYMEADVVIMIGTPDPTKHLEVLEQLNHIIEDKKSLQLLKKAKKPEDIIKLIQKREKEKKKC